MCSTTQEVWCVRHIRVTWNGHVCQRHHVNANGPGICVSSGGGILQFHRWIMVGKGGIFHLWQTAEVKILQVQVKKLPVTLAGKTSNHIWFVFSTGTVTKCELSDLPICLEELEQRFMPNTVGEKKKKKEDAINEFAFLMHLTHAWPLACILAICWIRVSAKASTNTKKKAL